MKIITEKELLYCNECGSNIKKAIVFQESNDVGAIVCFDCINKAYHLTNQKELIIKCSICKTKITDPGALLFTPPDYEDMCKKTHLCLKCYSHVFDFLDNITK